MAIITSPVSGSSVDAYQPNDVMGLLYTDLSTIIENANITLRYPEMERSYGEWGALIKRGFIPAADGASVNSRTTALPTPAYFNINMRMYDEWVEAEYASEIRRADVTKVLRGEMEYSDLLASIARRNLEGYRSDVNSSIDGAFTEINTENQPVNVLLATNGIGSSDPDLTVAASNGGGYLNPITGTQRVGVLQNATFRDVFSEILRTCMHMTVENTTYMGVPNNSNYTRGCQMDDLTVYLPIDFMAAADIKYLQTLFNLSGIERLPTIKMHNGGNIQYGVSFTEKAQVAYILEKSTLNHVNRFMSYDEFSMPGRYSTRATLHVEHGLFYYPFAKAYAIVFTMPTE